MKTSRVRRRLAPAVGVGLAVLFLITASGCGGEKIESRRLDREIAIDGTTADWDGALRNLDERLLSIGVMNDDEYLYLCIVTDDEALVRQVVMQGLTTAFVPEGTKEGDAFRVRFPVGRRPGGPREERPREEERTVGNGPPEGERPVWNASLPDSVFLEALRVVELQGPGGRAGRTMDVARATPVEIGAGRIGETFVYELRVPLQGDDLQPWAVGASGGGRFELLLKTPEIDFSAMRERMDRRGGGDGGGDDFGGRPGGGGGMGGPGGMGGGRSPGGGGPMKPEALDVKLEIHLAPAP